MSILHLIPLITVIGIFLFLYLLLHFSVLKRAAKKDSKRLSALFKNSGNSINQEELILEMAESYEKAGRKEKAIEHYELYLFKKNSSDPEILFKIGNLYGIESFEKAKEFWQKAADRGYPEAERMMESLRDS